VRPDEVRLVPCELHELIDAVLDGMLKTVMAEAGATVERQYDSQLKTVVCDPERLQQVLLNLLKNAADALEGSGLVTVHTQREGTSFVIEIADTGKGMESVELERVFMPFFTTKAPGSGTGLGLSVSCGIVAGLGGRLAVTSAPGVGSVFRIEHPCGR
jgi:signal transduction histidine kinase